MKKGEGYFLKFSFIHSFSVAQEVTMCVLCEGVLYESIVNTENKQNVVKNILNDCTE